MYHYKFKIFIIKKNYRVTRKINNIIPVITYYSFTINNFSFFNNQNLTILPKKPRFSHNNLNIHYHYHIYYHNRNNYIVKVTFRRTKGPTRLSFVPQQPPERPLQRKEQFRGGNRRLPHKD